MDNEANKELIQSVIETFMKLRPLVGAQFVKPLKEAERGMFPPGDHHVMFCIKALDKGPISMTDLATAASIAKPNLTAIIDRLVSEGLVERSNDANDRRIVNVVLTPEGAKFMKRHKEEMVNFMKKQFAVLDAPDLEILKKALEDITKVMEKMDK